MQRLRLDYFIRERPYFVAQLMCFYHQHTIYLLPRGSPRGQTGLGLQPSPTHMCMCLGCGEWEGR